MGHGVVRFWQERQEAALSKITGRKEADGREGNGGSRLATTEERKRDNHQEDSDEEILIKGQDRLNLLVDVRGGDKKRRITWYATKLHSNALVCLCRPLRLSVGCLYSISKRDVTD